MEFCITTKEYAELTGLKVDSAYTILNRVVDALYDHSVIFYHPDKDRDIRTRLINSCSYKDGCFYISFTHFALYIMYVFNQQNSFTKFKVKSAISLRRLGRLARQPLRPGAEVRSAVDRPAERLQRRQCGEGEAGDRLADNGRRPDQQGRPGRGDPGQQQADLVVMGRAQLADPDFVAKVSTGREDDVIYCIGCNQGCYDGFVSPDMPHITCLRNPSVGLEGPSRN